MGGEIDFHGGFPPAAAAIGGTIQVVASSLITSDQTGANAANIAVLSDLSGSGNLTVNMLSPGAYNVILFGTNTTYSGSWSNANGGLIIEGSTTNALGSGPVTLQVADAFLGFNTTNSLVISNSIYGEGNILQMNTNTVALDGNTAITGSLIISNGVIQLGNSSISNAALISIVGGTLDASQIGGLILRSNQIVNCDGTIINNLTAIGTPVLGTNALNFNFSGTTHSVLNVTGSLTLNGSPNLNIIASGYINPGTYTLINYSGGIQGGGSFNLVPPNGSTETFQVSTSTPGQLNLIVVGPNYNITWVGDGANNNWDTISENWIGAANVFANGDDVTFNDSGSATPFINLAVPVAPGSMTVSNTVNYYTFQGFGITMSGSFIKMGANEVDLISSSNDITGPVTIESGILSLGNGGITTSLGTPSSITNNGILQVNELNNGVTLNSPISGSGSLIITGGGADVNIDASNSYTGTTTIGSGCQLNTATSSGFGNSTDVVTVLSGGRVGVSTSVGSMTVPQPLVINGYGVSPAGAIYVNTTGNNVTWAGPVTVASDSQIRAVNVNVNDNFSNTVLGTNVTLECTSGNTTGDSSTVMTFENTVSLGTGGSLTADGLAVVVLAGKTNVWGGGTTVANYNGANGTLLVNGTLNGGPLSVNNLNNLGGSGTILDPVTMDGTLAPGSIGGIGTLTVSNTVTIDDDGAVLIDINRTSVPNASFLSTTNLTLESGSTLTVANIGSTNLQAGDTFTLFAGGTINGTFGVTNLPALPSPNFYWDTSLLTSQGIIKVDSTVVPQPSITSISVSGTTLAISAVNGVADGQYVLLESTNLLLPLSQWTPVLTNTFNGMGDLNLSTNIINRSNAHEFFILSQ